MKNKFTVDNAAMLLIDHQVGTIKLALSTPHDEIVQNTRALARTAVETKMPLVLTSSMETEFQGLLLDDLRTIAPEAYEKRVKRPGIVDCWEYDDYKNAVVATGKKKLIMAGLTNDVCTVYPAISAVEDGYEVQVVVDVLAGAVSYNIGYTFKKRRFQPRLGFNGDLVSGDRDPRDSDLQTFYPLFANNGYYGDIGLLNPANLIDAQPSVDLKLSETITAAAECWFFWRQSRRDGIYSPGTVPVRAAAPSQARYVGAQPGLTVKWQADRHMTWTLLYSHFTPGRFIRETPPNRPVTYFSVYVQYKF